MKILKRNRKSCRSFKYIKIYFSHGIDEFCREDREDFFLRKKTTKWFIKSIKYRNKPARFKIYEYITWEEIIPSEIFKKEFKKSYDDYIFYLRNKKLNRLV